MFFERFLHFFDQFDGSSFFHLTDMTDCLTDLTNAYMLMATKVGHMGKKISSDADTILARAYLTGRPRDEAAANASVSTGSVSNYWANFRELIGTEGEAVRDLSIKLDRMGLSVEQAASGAEIVDKLKAMDISVGKLGAFVSNLYQESINQGHAPKQIVTLANELYEMKAQTGKSYEELFNDFKVKKEEIAKLEQTITDKREEYKKINEDTKSALEGRQTTIGVLNEYLASKSKLEKYSYKISDAFTLCKMISNAEEQNYDVEKILELMAQTSSISDEYAGIVKDVSVLRSEKSTLEKEINHLKLEKATLLSSIKEISDSAIPRIKEIAEEADAKLEDLKATIKNSIQEIRQVSEAQRSQLVETAKVPIKELESIIGEINPAIYQLSNAQAIGEEVGKFEALYPMFKLFSEKEVSEQEMLPLLKATLYRFTQWLILKNVDSNLKEKTEALLFSIDERIKS